MKQYMNRKIIPTLLSLIIILTSIPIFVFNVSSTVSAQEHLSFLPTGFVAKDGIRCLQFGEWEGNPLLWRVLEVYEENGSRYAFVVLDDVLYDGDGKVHNIRGNDRIATANFWYYYVLKMVCNGRGGGDISGIYSRTYPNQFLNTDFYNKAFTSEEKSRIKKTMIGLEPSEYVNVPIDFKAEILDTMDDLIYSKVIANDGIYDENPDELPQRKSSSFPPAGEIIYENLKTSELSYIYLLSTDEMKNTDYFPTEASRQTMTADSYWLRSSTTAFHLGTAVALDGSLAYSPMTTSMGLRPCMRIKLDNMSEKDHPLSFAHDFTVTDNTNDGGTGRPIKGVTVTVNSLKTTYTTNGNGDARIYLPYDGGDFDYDVSFEKEGFESYNLKQLKQAVLDQGEVFVFGPNTPITLKGIPNKYDPLDVQKINEFIDQYSLKDVDGTSMPKANPADGSYIPREWYRSTIITGNFFDNTFEQTLITPFTIWSSDSPKRLVGLSLENKNITGSINMSVFTAITELNVAQNKITDLILTGLSELKKLKCNNNQLTELKLVGETEGSSLIKLEEINCANNQISLLNLNGFSKLKYLNCANNKLSSLDLTSSHLISEIKNDFNPDPLNPEINNGFNSDSLVFNNNPLTTLVFSRLINESSKRYECNVLLSANGNSYLQEIYFFTNPYITVVANPDVGYYLNNWTIVGAGLIRPGVNKANFNWETDTETIKVTPNFSQLQPDQCDPADLAVINAMIDNNGLNWTKWDGVSKTAPDDWAGTGNYYAIESLRSPNNVLMLEGMPYITWSNTTPARITHLYLVDKGLSGVVDLSGLNSLEIFQGNSMAITKLIFPDASQLSTTTDPSAMGNIIIEYNSSNSSVTLKPPVDAGNYRFSHWITDGLTSLPVSKNDFSLQGGSSLATAIYDEVYKVSQFALNVDKSIISNVYFNMSEANLKGMGRYLPESEVFISCPDQLANGMNFIGWKVIEGNITLVSPLSSSTSFIMPKENVTLHAKYDYLVTAALSKITPETATMNRKESKTFNARVILNVPTGASEYRWNDFPTKVNWYVWDGNAEDTVIDENGKLTIGEFESATTLTVSAVSAQGFKEEAIITVNNPHVHDFSAEWKFDADNHWHECSTKDISDKAAHTAETDDGDCTTAVHCTICNAVIIEAKSHISSGILDFNQDDPCANADCNFLFREANSHTPKQDDGDCTTAIHCLLCDAITTVANTNHTSDQAHASDCGASDKCIHCDYDFANNTLHTPGVAPTCTTAQLCTTCGKMIAAPIPHPYSTIWENDIDNHWQSCTCGATTYLATHTTSGWITDVIATETENGTKHKECIVCGYVIETEEIPSLTGQHTHNYEATWQYDADNHWNVCSCGLSNNISLHTSSAWIIDILATTSTEGSKHKQCTVCALVIETEIIPTLQKTYIITEGENQSWQKGTINGLQIFCYEEFAKFYGIKIDDVFISAEHFDVVSGSNIITLKPEYLQTLDEGLHTIEIVYEEGIAQTTLTILSTENSLQNDDIEKNNIDDYGKPKSGYISYVVYLWILIASCTGFWIVKALRRTKAKL